MMQNCIYGEISPQTFRMAAIEKKKMRVGEEVEKRNSCSGWLECRWFSLRPYGVPRNIRWTIGLPGVPWIGNLPAMQGH